MTSLDLHRKTHEEALHLVDIFIKQHLHDLPLEIITGNSERMQSIVKEVTDTYGLRCELMNHFNLGTLIINEQL